MMSSLNPSFASSLFSMSAQSSAFQAGAVMRVAAISFSGSGIHYTTGIDLAEPGYADPALAPKSARELAREQMANVLGILQKGLDQAGETLRETWSDMIARGEMDADPEAEIAQMRDLAGQKGALPEAMRDMVQLHAKAEESLKALSVEANQIDFRMSRQENAEFYKQVGMLVNRAVVDLVDAQLAMESRPDRSMQEAETALKLIRMMNGDGTVSSEQQEAIFRIAEDARQTKFLARRSDMNKEFHEKLDSGRLSYSVDFATVWADQKVAVSMPGGQMTAVYAAQGYHMASASATASLSGGLVSSWL